MSSKPATRARKKAETRDALKQAARQCFAERGYAATQVGDIARAAGVAHGTFYVHFQTKEQLTHELLVELNRQLLESLEATWERHAGAAPRAVVEALAEACLDVWARERELLAAFAERAGAAERLATLRDGSSPPVAELLLERLSSLAGPVEHAELVAQALLGMWLQVGVRYVFGPRISKKAAAGLLARLSLGAVGAVAPGLAPASEGRR